MFGVVGLIFSFTDDAGQIGSKIPLTIFFIFIMCVGITLQMLPKEWLEGVVGEVGPPREFG